ncbi:ribosome biogenesis GTP-binding protein YihA/YsxC, partial [Myxococcota bacterium]
MIISNPRFVVGAAALTQCPSWDRPEIAFGGRSNVGKSSLLRALLRSRRLVRVSRTPGRTQQLNFFDLELQKIPCAFVDLPGYGYAKASRRATHRWGQLVEQYLVSRSQLRGVVLLVDARRSPEAEENELVSFLRERDRSCVAVYTKVDKLPKTKRDGLLWRHHKALGLPGKPVGFSAITGQGRDAVLSRLVRLLGPADPRVFAPGDASLRSAAATPADLDDIMAIEEVSFSAPWSRGAIAEEIQRPWSIFRVLRDDEGRLLAYLNFWVIHAEIHLLNIATHPEHRRRGCARLLLDE